LLGDSKQHLPVGVGAAVAVVAVVIAAKDPASVVAVVDGNSEGVLADGLADCPGHRDLLTGEGLCVVQNLASGDAATPRGVTSAGVPVLVRWWLSLVWGLGLVRRLGLIASFIPAAAASAESQRRRGGYGD
jgi:hypothetical protein